jgi:protease-4
MNLRFILILTFIILSAGFLAAQTTDYIGALNHSIATTDNFMSPLVNPAALGYGNAGGVGWMHLVKKDKWQDHYWLLLNTDGLSYVYEKDEVWKNGGWRDQSVHTLATGSETFTAFKLPNLYTGLSYKWINNKFNEGNFRTGVLYRPANFASLGFTLDNPHKASPSYQFGLGVRPLGFVSKDNAYRLELSADLKYSKEDGDYTMFKPTLGVKTQLLPGVMIGGNYDLESETSMLSFSLGIRKGATGSDFHNEDDNNYEIAYLTANAKEFLPFLGKVRKQWYTPNVRNQVVTYKAPSFEAGPFRIFDNRQTGVESLIKDINQAKTDPQVSGLLFVNKNFSASLALKQELIAALREFKTSGKPVIFYYNGMSNGDYIFAASVADKIYLNPMGGVDLKGISATSPYLKGALNAIGIDVYNFRSHPTKTAGNMLSETDMIPEERAMYESLLGDLYNQMCEQIASGRGSRLVKSVQQTIDEGPYFLAEDALRAGLVDALIYETQLEETLKNEYKFTARSKELPLYQDYNWSHPKQDKIAVIYAQGNIVMGRGAVGKKIAHETTAELIRKVRKNPEYKGIILRIDSGGGSAQASDIIWNEIELAKTENKKPVVVSMSGVAGSGGYYIACNADHIIAEPATLTGSIGVIGISFSMQRLWQKLHINWDSVKKGEHSDFGNTSRQMTESEQAILTNTISRIYHDFVSKVAAGRKLDPAAMDSLAQGKVWTGLQGKNLGLVDELGGMAEAVKKVKELANLKHDVVLVDPSQTDKFSVGLEMEPFMSMLPLGMAISELDGFLSLYDEWMQYKGEKVLFATPFDLEAIAAP